MQTINLMPLIVESSDCRESNVKKLLSVPKERHDNYKLHPER